MIITRRNLKPVQEKCQSQALVAKRGIEGVRQGNNYRLPWKPFFVGRHLGGAVFSRKHDVWILKTNNQTVHSIPVVELSVIESLRSCFNELIYGSCLEWIVYIDMTCLRDKIVVTAMEGRQCVVKTSFKNLPWLFRIMLCMWVSLVKHNCHEIYNLQIYSENSWTGSLAEWHVPFCSFHPLETTNNIAFHRTDHHDRLHIITCICFTVLEREWLL